MNRCSTWVWLYCTIIMYWLNCTARCSVVMLPQSFRSLCFCGGRRKRWTCYVRRDLLSMQRKTARKEAWRPNCAAPRLVHGSAPFFKTFVHVYVRTIRTTKYIQREKKRENPVGGQVSGWTCTCVHKFRVYLSDRNGVHINFWCGKHVYLRETFYRVWHAWSTCSPLVQKKTKIIPGTDVFLTETRGDYFWTFWWPAVGGDTFSPLAPILGPV